MTKYKVSIPDFEIEVTEVSDAPADPVVVTADGNRDNAGFIHLPYIARKDGSTPTITMDMQPKEAITQVYNVMVYLRSTFGKGLRMKLGNVDTAVDFAVALKPRQVIDDVIQEEYLNEIKNPGDYLYCITDWLEGQNRLVHQLIKDETYAYLHVVGEPETIRADKFYFKPLDDMGIEGYIRD